MNGSQPVPQGSGIEAGDLRPVSASMSGPDWSAVELEELLRAADHAAESGTPAAREWIIQMIYETLDRSVAGVGTRRRLPYGPRRRVPERGAPRRRWH